MSSSQLDKVLELYKALAKFPSPTAARILNKSNSDTNFSVVSTWSQRNLESGKTGKFNQYHVVDVSRNKSSTLLPSDSSSVLLSSLSPNEDYNAVIREITGDISNGSKKTQYLEVWKVSHLWKNVDLTSREVHGDVYSDGEFGSLEWSPCGEKVLYIAERKFPKSEPFYKTKPQDKKKEGSGDSKEESKVTKGEEHLFRQDWGEQLLGKSESVVAVADLRTETVSVLEGVPEHLCPGLVLWAPDGGVVGVAWNTSPRKLGLIFCSNRLSCIFHINCQGQFNVLSDEGVAVRSPRFSLDGKRLVWLERDIGGTHNGAFRLVSFHWETQQKSTVVDIVQENVKIEGGELFYGLYNLTLPKRCWAGNNHQLVLSTPQKYTVNTYIVDIESKLISRVNAGEGSLQVLDVWNEFLVCSKSSFNEPPVLMLGSLRSTKGSEDGWLVISEPQDSALLSGIHYSFLDLEQDEPASAVKTFSAMYIGPKDTKEGKEAEVPLVVFPHGGPHSGNVNMFTFSTALFNLLGWGVLVVNYRGSTGAGQASVEFLPGRIGVADVADMRLASATVLQRFPHLSKKKILLFGGSHGGFLVTHLSGRFPEDYKAVATINPVVDVAPMFSVSDIPDWTCVEAGVPFDMTGQISLESFSKMKECSPLAHCSPRSPPTLLLIGKKDARVPGSQGMALYYSLKAHGVTTKLLLYDDNHSLSQVPIEIDSLINAVLWFYEHL